MASSYNTRSTTTTTGATAISASSITMESSGQTTATSGTVQPRHFCIALTNNPRMLRKAQQELSFLAATTTTTNISTGSNEQPTVLPPQTRQRTASESRPQGLLPPLPFNPQQPQQMRLQSRIRPFRFRQQRAATIEQQVVPGSTQPASTETATSIERRTYEKNIEEDFKVQIQPLLQNYLNKTQRSPPINSFLDMSSLIKY